MDTLPSENERLSASDTFRFSCRPELSCFNHCCANKHLPLTPYDVLRIKAALGLTSDELLARHTLYSIDPSTGFPVISIRMGDDPEKTCPFVSPKGCTVYENRPTACRLYPLARAVSADPMGDVVKEFFYSIDTPVCLGIREREVRSVEQWLDDQGLPSYLGMNDRVVGFVLTTKKRLGKPLDERSLHKVLVALYNLDVFRDFVFSTQILDILQTKEPLRDRIRNDDTALLELALTYLGRARLS